MLKFIEKILITKKNVAKNKSIAGEGNSNNQIADTINNVQTQPLMMSIPLISEQARIFFNDNMKAYGCPGDYLSFEQEYKLSPKFRIEVDVARNEFIKWAQDNSKDGIHLPPYKDCNAKAKEIWAKFVKSPRYKTGEE